MHWSTESSLELTASTSAFDPASCDMFLPEVASWVCPMSKYDSFVHDCLFPLWLTKVEHRSRESRDMNTDGFLMHFGPFQLHAEHSDIGSLLETLTQHPWHLTMDMFRQKMMKGQSWGRLCVGELLWGTEQRYRWSPLLPAVNDDERESRWIRFSLFLRTAFGFSEAFAPPCSHCLERSKLTRTVKVVINIRLDQTALENWRDVRTWLGTKGATVRAVPMETLAMAEVASLMRDCDIYIATHGSRAPDVLFAPQRMVHVDILPPLGNVSPTPPSPSSSSSSPETMVSPLAWRTAPLNFTFAAETVVNDLPTVLSNRFLVRWHSAANTSSPLSTSLTEHVTLPLSELDFIWRASLALLGTQRPIEERTVFA